MSVPNKKGNNMNNFNFAKMRCVKRAYMNESVWTWFITFVDYMSRLLPKHSVATGDLCALQAHVNFGFGVSIEPQGPPNE